MTEQPIVAGAYVVLVSGSVAMEVRRVTSGKATCFWENRHGEMETETYPVADLKIYDGKNAIPDVG